MQAECSFSEMLYNRSSLDFRICFQDFEVFVDTNPNTMIYLEHGNSKHRIHLFFIAHSLKVILHIFNILTF